MLPLWLVTVILFALAARATADPIRVVFDDRGLFASIDVVDNQRDVTEIEVQDRQKDFLVARATHSSGGFSATARSTLSSTLSPGHFLGSGTAVALATVPATNQVLARAMGDTSAGFGVAFALDTTLPFAFDATFIVVEAGLNPSVEISTALSRQDQRIFQHSSRETHTERERGLLLPGLYSLGIFVRASAATIKPETTSQAAGLFGFTFDVPAATPEPTSIALLGSGVLGIVGICRQSRTRRM
jgi:hypothetical protein